MKDGMKVGNDRHGPVSCQEYEDLLVFYVCDELEAGERVAVEQHIGVCAACAASLSRELRLHQAIAAAERPAEQLDPSDLLLSQCRSELAEALDEAEANRSRQGWLVGVGPARWLTWLSSKLLVPSFVRHPAWSAALLVLLGVVVGRLAPEWYPTQSTQPLGKPAVTVSAAPRLSDQELQTMGVNNINWALDNGTGTPSVEVHVTTEKPLVVQGSPDDTDVKRVLTFVMLNGQRFDSGVRLDSVDVLWTRSGDTEVRRALCAAARKDHNPGVRLRALEALRGFEEEDSVRQALLDALVNDDCPGVRVEAINSLVGALRAAGEKGAAPQDPHLLQVLRDRMEKDPNNYIRMQSAAAVRQLGPRETY